MIDRRRLLWIALLGIASAALLLWWGGGQAALTTVANANWWLVGLAVAVHYSSFALRGRRWQTLLAVAGYRFSYLYTTTLLLAGWFASALLPARAGDLLRVGILRLGSERYAPVPVAGSLSTIVLERVLDILAILVLGAGFGFALLRTQLPAWLLGAYALGIGLLVGFGAGLLLAPPLLGGLRKLPWLAQWRLWQKSMDFLVQLVAGMRTLFRQPVTAALVVVESLLIWLGDALLVWLVALSLGAPLPLPAAAFAALTVDVLAAVPLTPGGVGQIDAAYAALLALLALPATHVGALVILVRLISYWSFLAFSGLVTLVAGFGSLLPRALAAATGAPAAGVQASSPAPAAQDGQAGTPALQ